MGVTHGGDRGARGGVARGFQPGPGGDDGLASTAGRDGLESRCERGDRGGPPRPRLAGSTRELREKCEDRPSLCRTVHFEQELAATSLDRKGEKGTAGLLPGDVLA